jgi:5-methyltetrahydropteroyltriglutamate--homocysteine methyltransferase
MTAAPLKPPFRADQVGSLLRPAHLIEARGKLRKREIDAAALTAIEDAAIREVVAQQEAIGLNSISDGEFRRQSYIVDFFRKALGSGGLTAEQGSSSIATSRGSGFRLRSLSFTNRSNGPGRSSPSISRF